VSVVHRTYARSLYEAAKEAGRVAPVREQLGDFADAMEQVPELAEILRNPQLDRRAKAAAIDAVAGDADQLVKNLLLLLVEKGRGGEVGEVASEFEQLAAREEGQLNVELTTAIELSEDEARQIVGQIERVSGRSVEAERKVDPNLIGGIVLHAGSLRVDASVRGRLERLTRDLVTRA
jgi:F-type H+-transporting ATPase subunit delta